MHRSAYTDLLILLLIGAAIFTGGFLIVKKINTSAFDFDYTISLEQEEDLGKLLCEAVAGKFNIVERNSADSAIQEISNRLIRSLDTVSFHYRFTIIKSDDINAFTIPGGNIFIFSGLLKACESPEEVAAVLSHEIGHAEERHVMKKITKDLSIAVLVSILTGGDPSLITSILQDVVANTFNREQENEADQFGLTLLEKASIDPKFMAAFFERLNEKDLSYNKNLEILMTHPHNDVRIENAKKFRTQEEFVAVPFEINWERVKDSL